MVPRLLGMLTRSEHVWVPFDTVQVDLQGPIVPPSTEGWRYVLTVVCTYTRYASLRGTRTKSKQEVAKVIVDVFLELGTFPRVLVSDRGTEFINDLMGEVLSVLRVFRFSAPAYTPRVSGMVERSHRAMATILRALVAHFVGEHRGRWGVFLPCVQYHLRHLQFASSNATPFQLVNAWAAATPMQRSLAPWALVPKELPYEDWVQELVATWRKITDRFAAYTRRRQRIGGIASTPGSPTARVISSCWSALRWRGTLRESWASAWKVRTECGVRSPSTVWS